ncbi:MAG TPA: hypothetical protein PK858_12255 [Saprospiraceae bacterium]|nr:hypothetical protein [Saprospiraceae bacterium]
MLEALRQYFFRSRLRHLMAQHKRTRRVHTLDTAKTVSILFEATSDRMRQEVLDYARSLEKKGKKVQLLGYYDQPKSPEPSPDFPFFFKKENAWTGEPKSERAARFAQEKPDLLLVFNPHDLPPLMWVAIQSAAAMKIGYATVQTHDLDVQLDTPAEKGIKHFADQLDLYLSKIK